MNKIGCKYVRAVGDDGITSGHINQLLTGYDYFNDGYGETPEAIEAMRAAWPVLRKRVFSALRVKQKRGVERYMPWAWWKFEHGIHLRIHGEKELLQGLLDSGKVTLAELPKTTRKMLA